MLKKITKWETEDGKVFDTQEEVEDYMFEQDKEVMTRTTEQERFEAWYEENIGDENKPVREAAFSAWQAARRAPAVPVPQGYRLQPLSEYDAMCEFISAAPQPAAAALVPSIAVTPEMVESANEAYCPFGDMELALCAALQVAPIPPGAAPVKEE